MKNVSRLCCLSLLGWLLATALPIPAASTNAPAKKGAESEAVSRKELDRERTIIENKISDGRNEMRSVTNRIDDALFGPAERNLVVARMRVDTALRLLEKHKDRIDLLQRGGWFHNATLRGLEKRYEAVRSSAYELQDNILSSAQRLRKKMPGERIALFDQYESIRGEVLGQADFVEKLEQAARDIEHGTRPTIFGPADSSSGALPPNTKSE